MANYVVEGKKVIAKVDKLTAKEVSAVKNYLTLGYTLVEPEKKPKKKPKEEFKAATIQAWLTDNATKAQQKEYWDIFNAPVIDKETGEQKIVKKTGKGKVKGHVATLSWFKKTFPDYPEKK